MSAAENGIKPSCTKIHAVIPVHNRRDLSVACLRSLLGSRLTNVDLRVFVYDSGSNDGTAAAITEQFPEVFVIAGNADAHYTAATNRGIAAAMADNPDFILCCNDDTVFPIDCLQLLLECARCNPCSIVGPALIDWERPQRVMQVAPVWSMWYGGWRHFEADRIDDLPGCAFYVQALVGNCILFPIQSIVENGLMAEGLLPLYGDGEYSTRMRKAGWRLIVEPRARLMCQPNAILPSLRRIGLKAQFGALLAERTDRNNLLQLFSVMWLSAPSRTQALLAIVVYIVRLLLKAANLAGTWPASWPPVRLIDRVTTVLSGAVEGRMPTVAYVWPYLSWGGVQTYFLGLADGVQRHGGHAFAACPAGTTKTMLAMMDDQGMEVHLLPVNSEIPARSIFDRLKRRWLTYRAESLLHDELAKIVPDSGVLHLDMAPWASYRTISRMLRRWPVMITLHTGLPRTSWWRSQLWRMRFSSLFKRKNFRLICATGDARKSLHCYAAPELLDNIPIDYSTMNSRHINAVLAPDASLPTLDGLAPSRCRFFVGAQFIDRKGRHILLEAMKILQREGVVVDVLWVGTQPLSPQDEALISAAKLGPGFVYLDNSGGRFLHPEYLALLFRYGDVFLLPSLEEGLPLAMIEAMALGKPALVTAIAAIPEVIRHGKNGWLVHPGDPKVLAEAMRTLAADPGLRAILGRTAKNEVQERFDSTSDKRATLAVYRHLGHSG